MKRLLVLFAALMVARLAAGQNSAGATPVQSLGNGSPILISAIKTPEKVPGYTFRTSVREVRVNFAVDGKRGRPVTWLKAEDIEVLDSGKEIAQLSSFEKENSLPLRIVFMIDSSESTAKILPMLKAIAPEFLNSVFRPELDSGMLVSFDTKPTCEQGFTGDTQLIVNSLEKVKSGGLTSLFDSLLLVLKTDFRVESNQPERRLVILLSDGIDTYSMHSRNDVILELNRLGIALYAVYAGPKDMPVSGTSNLEALANYTGGKAFFPQKPKALAPAFVEIANDLRSQYSLTFRVPAATDGSFHRISIRPRNGERWKIRARAGYFAEPEKGPTTSSNMMVATK